MEIGLNELEFLITANDDSGQSQNFRLLRTYEILTLFIFVVAV